MRPSPLVICLLAAFPSAYAQSTSSSAAPSVQTIEVGNGGFSYNPNSTTLAVGSVIVFKFMSTNHTVGKAAFGVPCQPYDYIVRGAESFYSGVFNGEDTFSANPPTWNLTINTTEPTYFYCTAPGSCVDNHMIGIINPNSTQDLKAQEAYINGDTIMLKPGETLGAEGGPASTSSSPSNTASSTNSATSAAVAHSGGSVSGGAIAGIVVGAVVAFALVGAVLWYRSRHRKYRQDMRAASGSGSDGANRWSASYKGSPQPNEKDMEMRDMYGVDRVGSPEMGGHTAYAPRTIHELVDEESEKIGPAVSSRLSTTSELSGDIPHSRVQSGQYQTIHEID